MKNRKLLFALFSLALTSPLPVAAQTSIEEATELLAAGNVALDGAELEKAEELFSAGVRSISRLIANQTEAGAEPGAETVELRDRLEFHLALAYQIHGERDGDDATLLARALRLYKNLLERRPDSGTTLVNLAQVEERLGDRGTAEGLFRRAIALEDARRPIYEEKYAEFLARDTSAANGKERSTEVYLDLLERQPDNPKAQREVLGYYLDPGVGADRLPRILWKLVEAGEVLTAQRTALAALGETSSAWPERSREELLAVVAASLGRQHRQPGELPASDLGETLAGLRQDPQIGPGVAELLKLYESPGEYTASDFTWWGRPAHEWADPERGLWLRDAFRRPMRAVGSWYESRQEYGIAESCYEAATLIAPDEIDPRSMRALADLYVRQKRIDKIEELAGKYQVQLIEAKNEAYRKAQTERIYEYHRTLGGIYGNLARKTGEWGDSSTVASAIFQLERAKRFGEELDRSQSRRPASLSPESKDKLHVDPGLINLLAQGYVAKDRQKDSDALRIEAAESYESKGNLRARDLVLEPIAVERLDTTTRERYLALSPVRQPDRVPEHQIEDRKLEKPERRIDGGGSER